ncbi:family 20 glycosylhydrolase [Mucilaginibacter sabulilitoris]|uniref:beta-N-acetylhexosaminidase n=1 Tax=Mucilaginibacter sabulilitoris TaxID=1173583 RepID=A0ABZ0TIQ2_9SPHI|nr:family 20 glycosylhydrolase [Mucilaginibacter sabulilitoris]WPU92686.1 family 20 glycosylhydrolase [Mucilaginibacter sabulilitoris]
MNQNYNSTLKPFLIALSVLLAFSLQAKLVKAQAPADDPHLGIIPAPASITKAAGTFTFSQLTQIKADNIKDRNVVFLKDFLLNNRHFNNKLSKYNPRIRSNRGTTLIITGRGSTTLPKEGYKLTITPRRITIIGKGAGLFYGIQTFMQLFPVETSGTEKLPCITIEDSPRFGYRGMMLDVSRHFFTVPQVKKVIELMAAYKLNNFHWHLVDGQGWRIEIKKYPKLTEVGAYRKQTMYGTNRDWPDSLSYGGYYTQDEIRDVVKFAAARYINVVPEIEMPAHSEAALRAYPELRCELPADSKVPAREVNNIYCPTPETFTFLENVLTEVMELFPSKYIHIGGDEANKEPWKASAFCQALIKEKGLKDEHELQSYFIQTIEKFLNSKGRSIIGWDEILEGGLAPNATVMSWTGEEGGIAAARQKHNVIMTPQTTGNYFDHYQSSSPQEPVSFGRYAALDETYNYDPVSKELTPEEQQYVIGTQGNLWTEYVPTVAKLQYQILPRLFALSEVAWSKPENKDYTNFSEVRLAKHFARLEAMHYNYRVPTALPIIDTMVFGSQFTFAPKSVVPGARIYYTLNGRDPLDTDLEYVSPITIYVPANEKREFKTRVITPTGRRSIATRTLMYNRALLPAVNYSANKPGLNCTLIKDTFTVPDQLDYASGGESAIADKLNAESFKKDNQHFGMVFSGYVNIPADGAYTFSQASYTDTQLFIDDQKVTESENALPLVKGFHKIKVKYIYNAPVLLPGAYRIRQTPLRVFMTAPGTVEKKEFEPAMLFN